MTNGLVAAAFLVDTNVLVYGHDAAEANKQRRAIALLRSLQRDQLGVLTAQVLGEFYNSVTRRIATPLSHTDAENEVTRFARSWPVLDITGTIVLEAVRGAQRFQLAYWDALIWASAKMNGVPNVLSEDFNDGAVLEGVRFLNPFSSSFDMSRLSPGR